MSTTPQRDITANQPATESAEISRATTAPSSPDANRPTVNNLGINEAKEMTGYPQVGQGANVSMTDAQPGGGPTVTTEAGPY